MLFKVTTDPAPVNPKVSDTQFKLFFPSINRNMEWCTIEPFIQNAEDQEIIPAIGQEFYDVLETEYQASGTIADTTKAYTFRLLQTALAHYSMAIGLPLLNMRVGDAGAAENSSNDIIPVRQWVFNGSRWGILKQAYKYLDMALAHMESQVSAANSDYDAFANSEAYTISQELLIPNARVFQRHYNIQSSRRAYTALRPYIEKAEQIKLKPVLCELFDEIKTQFSAGTLTAANQTLIAPIQRLLAEYTIEMAIPDINFVNDGAGWMVSENTYDSKPMGSNLSQAVQQLLTKAEQNATAFEIALKNEIYADLDSYPTYRDGKCNDLTEDSNDNGVADIDEYCPPEAGAVIL